MQLVSCSGGIDSISVAVLTRPSALLFVDYGQPAREQELHYCRQAAEYLNIPLKTIQVDGYEFGLGYIPCRNFFLLSLATPYAVKHNYSEIAFGFTKEAFHPDTTPEWVQLVNLCLKFEGLSVRVIAPAIELTKVELIQRALKVYDVTKSHSCFYNEPCGICGKCKERAAALFALGYT